MFDRRSFAHNKCSPAKMHSGRYDRVCIGSHLVITAAALRLMQLQAVQRALTPERRALGSTRRFELAQQRAKYRIVPQGLMVVDVLVPQRHSENTLSDQRPYRVLDQHRTGRFNKTSRQPINQSDRFIGATGRIAARTATVAGECVAQVFGPATASPHTASASGTFVCRPK